MRTFSERPKAGETTTATKSTIPDRPHFGENRKASSILYLQRTIGNRAVRQLLEKNATRCGGEPITEIARFSHDFSQIPLHSSATPTTQTLLAISKPWDDNDQITDVRDEMRPAPHTSPLTVSGLHFFAAPVKAPSIQRKPTISSPGDPFEREADDVADRVVRIVEPSPITTVPAAIRRKCTGCEEQEKGGRSQHASSAALQSIEGGEEEPTELTEVNVQRKAEFGAAAAASSPAVMDRLSGTQSGGELLASRTRYSMETAFGRDFSRVRVHRDSEAAELSHQLSALAFTHGSHIYFGRGKYDPEGSSGKRLLAHELAHVVQQGDAVLRSAAAPTVTAVETAAPRIQRAATWVAPVPHETNNLANTAVVGVPAGVTQLMINGAIGGALNGPTLTVSPAAAGGFDATVATVPVNTGSVDETVLSAGPWRRVTARATIGTLFPTLTQCTGAGNSNFRARGNPSDAAMAAANRRHEDRHAADGQAAFTGSVVPWDGRLAAANAAGTTFHGATDAAARAALFTAMGGTVVQITTALIAAWNAAIATYHGTPAGGPIGAPTDPTAAPNCSWSFARYTNPS